MSNDETKAKNIDEFISSLSEEEQAGIKEEYLNMRLDYSELSGVVTDCDQFKAYKMGYQTGYSQGKKDIVDMLKTIFEKE